MEFEVKEIKMLGIGLGRSISLRLDRVPDTGEGQAQAGGYPSRSAYTIHAVVPFSPEFATVQIGQRFTFGHSIRALCDNPEELDNFRTGHHFRVVRQETGRIADLNRRHHLRELTCDEAGCEGDPAVGSMKHAEGCSIRYTRK